MIFNKLIKRENKKLTIEIWLRKWTGVHSLEIIKILDTLNFNIELLSIETRDGTGKYLKYYNPYQE